MTYTEACERAATDQNLDPISEELSRHGIPHYIDQTGGFCMVVRVPLSEDGKHYLYMTDAVDYASGPVGWVAAGEYWECEDWHGEGLQEWMGDQLRLPGVVGIPEENKAAWDALYASAMHPLEDLRAVVTEAATANRKCPYCDS